VWKEEEKQRRKCFSFGGLKRIRVTRESRVFFGSCVDLLGFLILFRAFAYWALFSILCCLGKCFGASSRLLQVVW
jgi:hypothetical protein